VDPQYALLARDPEANYLSLRELRERYRSGAPVSFEFIGNEYHRFAHKQPQLNKLYDDRQDFHTIGTLWGNNVFEEDRLHERLRPLPFIARQTLGLVSGVLPGLRFRDDEPEAGRLARVRKGPLAAVPLLVLGTLAWPTMRLVRRCG
jgi:hypothetical protein